MYKTVGSVYVVFSGLKLSINAMTSPKDQAFCDSWRVGQVGWDVIVEVVTFFKKIRHNLVVYNGDCDVQKINFCLKAIQLPTEAMESTQVSLKG